MKKDREQPNRSLKWKMVFFKIHYIVIYLIFRPRRFFINKKAKQKYKETKKPLIFAYNHVGFYDGLTIWNAFILKNIRFLAMKEIDTNGFSRFFFNWNGLILIDRSNFSVKDFRTLINSVNSGYSLGIAPEGTINRQVEFKDFQIGSAKIAKMTKTNILPLYFVPHRKSPYKRQHIHVGNIINVEDFKNAEDLNDSIKKSMEQLRYNAFFNNKSYVYVFPINSDIKEEDNKFNFHKKYNKENESNHYYSLKTAGYYLDKILREKYGLNLKAEDIIISDKGKPTHFDIKFDISYTNNIIAIVISSKECSVNIQKGSIKKAKIKNHKIKVSNEKYTLTVNAQGKLYIYDNLNNIL